MATIEAYDTAAGRRYQVRYRTPQRTQTKKRGFKTKRDAQEFAATVEVEKMSGHTCAEARDDHGWRDGPGSGCPASNPMWLRRTTERWSRRGVITSSQFGGRPDSPMSTLPPWSGGSPPWVRVRGDQRCPGLRRAGGHTRRRGEVTRLASNPARGVENLPRKPASGASTYPPRMSAGWLSRRGIIGR